MAEFPSNAGNFMEEEDGSAVKDKTAFTDDGYGDELNVDDVAAFTDDGDGNESDNDKPFADDGVTDVDTFKFVVIAVVKEDFLLDVELMDFEKSEKTEVVSIPME